jgi:hexosaminidase
LQIVLAPLASEEDRYAAQSLQEELKSDTEHEFPIVVSPRASSVSAVLLGEFDQPEIQKRLHERGISVNGVGAQGYVLDVSPDEVLVAGKEAAGLFYGVQTLRQLTVGQGQETQIIGARVRDWPALLYRGLEVDLARGPVPNLSYLKRVVRTIAEFKMNQLHLFMEDSFRVQGQPLIGLLSDTLSQEDLLELVAYSKRFHVGLTPSFESCGHQHPILRFEQYSGLSERPHGNIFAPGDPNVESFLSSVFDQLAAVFPGPDFNINCDETFELGLGRSSQKVHDEGYYKVYLDNLLQVYDLVRRYNKHVMFASDIAVKYPDIVPRLPKDMIVLAWEYFPHPNYDQWLAPFAKAGIRTIASPWIGNTSLITPDNEAAAANIGTLIADGKKFGVMGALTTVWNDDHETLFGQNWWGIVYAAAESWEPGKTSVEDFEQKYDWAFYRNTDHRFAQGIKKLSGINEIMRGSKGATTWEGYGGADNSLFWQNPFTSEGRAQALKILPVASQVRLATESSYTVFRDDASRARRNQDTLDELQFAALKIDALAMRYQYLQEVSERYANAIAFDRQKKKQLVWNELDEISGGEGRLLDLLEYTTYLRTLFERLWLSQNIPTWLPNVLQLYDRNCQMWQDLIDNFNRIDHEYGQGKPFPTPSSLGLLPVIVKD